MATLDLIDLGDENWGTRQNANLTILNNAKQEVSTLDEDVAAFMADEASDLFEAANTHYPLTRVWDGSAYPTRVPSALNIFFGPDNPGLSMAGDDYWANPNVTTLDTVVSAAADTSSDLFAAIETATSGDIRKIPLQARPGDSTAFRAISGTALFGYEVPHGSTNGVIGSLPVPFGWNTARVRVIVARSAAGSGSIRLSRRGVTYSASNSTPVAIASTNNTFAVPDVGKVNSILMTVDIDLVAQDQILLEIFRIGGSAEDTFTGPVYIIDAQLEKRS